MSVALTKQAIIRGRAKLGALKRYIQIVPWERAEVEKQIAELQAEIQRARESVPQMMLKAWKL